MIARRRLALDHLDGNGHDLIFELPGLRRRGGPHLGGDAEFVQVLPREVVLLRQQFRPSELREGLVAHAKLLEALQSLAILRHVRFGHGVAMPCFNAIDDIGADGHGGHDLNATCDDAVVDAAHDSLGRRMDGLLRGAALAVDGRARHALREGLRGQHHVAPDVTRLRANLAHATEDHVLHLRWIHLGALHEGVANSSSKVGGMVARQLPVLLAPGGPARSNNVGGEGLEIRHCAKCHRGFADGAKRRPQSPNLS
mmetsp:Transcript_90431/g.193901  ORF Transcript_90431/g.193901 Transcript_90431/m.193901 type:complete len:255 (-) Transcript_90431:3-767(-)